MKVTLHIDGMHKKDSFLIATGMDNKKMNLSEVKKFLKDQPKTYFLWFITHPKYGLISGDEIMDGGYHESTKKILGRTK